MEFLFTLAEARESIVTQSYNIKEHNWLREDVNKIFASFFQHFFHFKTVTEAAWFESRKSEHHFKQIILLPILT